MGINEYDNMLQNDMKPVSGNNEYGSMIAEQADQQKQTLNVVMKQAAAVQPDQEAKYVDLANKNNLPVDFVKRNYDAVSQKLNQNGNEYDLMIQDTPKTADWLSKPENANVAHDDVSQLQGLENQVKDYGMLTQMYSALGQGLDQVGASLSKIPALAYDVAALPQNLINKAIGRDVQVSSPEWLRDNPVTQLYNERAQGFAQSAPLLQKSVTDQIAQGNFAEAGKVMAVQFVANAPQQAAMIAAGLGGKEGLGLLFAGLTSAADKNAQNQSQGGDAIVNVGNALATGSIEAGFEHLGTFGILHSWENALAKDFGKQVSGQVIKDFSKTLLYSMAGEGNEEFLTSVAQDLTDYITGVNPQALTGIGKRALDAGIIGAASGGVITAPSAITAGVSRMDSVKRAQLAKNFYSSFGNSALATKLRERLPDAQKQLVQEITKGTGVENVYLPVEAVETFFQSQKDKNKLGGEQLSPEAEAQSQAQSAQAAQENEKDNSETIRAMQEMGILQQYEQAKETGADMEIPLSTWVRNIGQTDSNYYEGLANDIKFHVDDMSVNEATKIRDEQRAALEAENKAAEDAQKEADFQERLDSSPTVGKVVEDQLRELGYTPKDAKAQGLLYQSTFQSLAQRTGLDARELFEKYNLNIGRVETKEQAPVQQGEEVLNQEQQPVAEVPAVPSGEETVTLDQNERGQIRIGKNSINIDLFGKADASTFLHETGHFYFKVLGDLASSENTPQQIKDDYDTLLKWMNVEDPKNISVDAQEQFARGFEAYLKEGKAPSSALRKAFNRFRIWLTGVYNTFNSLNVDLSDDVRGVMDRLVAADQQIQDAEQTLNTPPLFKDARSMGMSEAKALRYEASRQEAQERASETLAADVLKDFYRQKESIYKERRKSVRSQVEQEVSEQRVYKALDAIRYGNEVVGEPLKLSRQDLVNMYDAEFVKNRLPKPHIYAREGGVNPEVAAQLLGYESGDQMIQEIMNSPTKQEAIERITEQRMEQQYPSLTTPESLPQKAMEVVHNEKRGQVLRMELEHLASNDMPTLKEVIKKTVRRVPSDSQVKEQARDIIADKNVGDVKPYLYRRAESKAALLAGEALARGDIDEAFNQKRKELLNFELFNAATEAQADIKKSVKDLKKIFRSDEDIAKTRDTDMVNAARALLSDYGLGKSDKTANDYLKTMKSYDNDTYESVQAIIDTVGDNAKPYEQMSYNEFVELKEAVNTLWDLSKSSKQIEIDGVRLDRSKVIGELNARVDEVNQKNDAPGYDKAITDQQKFGMQLLGIKARLRRVEHWAYAMDKGNLNGPFTKYIARPIIDAQTRYDLAKVDVHRKISELTKNLDKNNTKIIEAPEIGYSFKNKQELLHAILHTGNESNLRKLLLGRQWGSLNEDKTLNRSVWDRMITRMQADGTITKQDYDFAQGVWDLAESLKPNAQKAHKKMYGYYFNEITSDGFKTPFGEYKGGYVPALVDGYMSMDATVRADKETLEKFNNTFMFPTTGRGFTKARVDQYNAPLLLDLNKIVSHMEKVVRFTELEPAVKDVARLVHDKTFSEKMAQMDRTVVSEMLIPWLQRSAQQTVVKPSDGIGGHLADKVAKTLRTRASMQVMALNVTNWIQNLTGVFPALVRVDAQHLAGSLSDFTKGPAELSGQIQGKSDYMRSRIGENARDITREYNEIVLQPTKMDKIGDAAKKFAFFGDKATNGFMEMLVWNGAYRQALSQNAEEKEAVKQADATVRQTLVDASPSGVSRIETGTAFERLFTMFQMFFNNQLNLITSEIEVAKEMGMTSKEGTKRAASAYVMIVMAPAIASAIISRVMSGRGLDADDDGSYIDDTLDIFFGSQLRFLTAMFPGGSILTTTLNTFNDKPWDDKINISPAASAVEQTIMAPSTVAAAVTGDASQSKALKNALTAIGMLTGLPTGIVSKPLTYATKVKEGDAEPTGPIDMVRGLTTGN